MSKNKELVKKLYATLMAEGDTITANELLSPNYVDHDIPGLGKGGREELKMAVQGIRAAFPDIKPNLTEVFEENDWVTVRVEAGGHHSGTDFLGIPPSGKEINWKELHIFRCEDNLIVEHKGVFDMLSILHQLGAIQMP